MRKGKRRGRKPHEEIEATERGFLGEKLLLRGWFLQKYCKVVQSSAKWCKFTESAKHKRDVTSQRVAPVTLALSPKRERGLRPRRSCTRVRGLRAAQRADSAFVSGIAISVSCAPFRGAMSLYI